MVVRKALNSYSLKFLLIRDCRTGKDGQDIKFVMRGYKHDGSHHDIHWTYRALARTISDERTLHEFCKHAVNELPQGHSANYTGRRA